MSEGVYLGFDFGVVRIGVAVANSITKKASGLAIVDARTNKTKWGEIQKLINEWQPSALIVGVPRHPDGQHHEVTMKALKFARQLEGRYALPVNVVDERYSSVEVEEEGNDEPIDDLAAAVILDQWFAEGEPVRPPQEENLDATQQNNTTVSGS